MTPENERTIVKFLVAALGQGRESARLFARRLPEDVLPKLLALAHSWQTKSCLEANQLFLQLMAGTAPQVPVMPDRPKKKAAVWTPEMRRKQAKLVKKQMAEAKKRRVEAADHLAAVLLRA